MNLNSGIHITEEELERIESYLSNKMSPPDREAFDLQLSHDGGFREKTEYVKMLITGIREVPVKKLLQTFENRLLEEKKITKGRVLNLRKWLVAASLFVVATFGAWLVYGPDKGTRMYENYFSPDVGLIGTMSAENDHYQFEAGMVEYKNKQYDSALQMWQPLLDLYPDNDTLQYFTAMAYLSKKQLNPARSLLEKLTHNKQSTFYQEASWYYGLILIKEEKWQEAVPYVKQSNHPKKEKLLKNM